MANLGCGNSGPAGARADRGAAARPPARRVERLLLPLVAEFNRPALDGEVIGELALPALGATIGFDARLPAGVAERMVTAAMANPVRENNRRPAGRAELRA